MFTGVSKTLQPWDAKILHLQVKLGTFGDQILLFWFPQLASKPSHHARKRYCIKIAGLTWATLSLTKRRIDLWSNFWWNYEELEEVKRRLQLKDCFRCRVFSYQFAVAFLMSAEVEKLYVDKHAEFRKRYLGLLYTPNENMFLKLITLDTCFGFWSFGHVESFRLWSFPEIMKPWCVFWCKDQVLRAKEEEVEELRRQLALLRDPGADPSGKTLKRWIWDWIADHEIIKSWQLWYQGWKHVETGCPNWSAFHGLLEFRAWAWLLYLKRVVPRFYHFHPSDSFFTARRASGWNALWRT